MSIHKMKQCRYGMMLFLRTDLYIGRSLDIYGEYCEGEAMVFRQILSPGDVVVEVGANIGPHTVHLAQHVGPSGLVYAFEPQRVIFQTLCANLALNDVFNVHAYHAGCGKAPGRIQVPTIDYSVDGSNFGGVSLLGAMYGEDIQLIALDALTFPALRLLKIDVEGMELDVVTGARKQIMQHRPIIYLENDKREKSADLIAAISALNYDCWWHFPSLFNRDNFFGTTENIFGQTGSLNVVCLPKEEPHTITGFRPVTGPQDWWFAEV